MDIKEVKGPVGFLKFWFQDAAPSKQGVEEIDSALV